MDQQLRIDIEAFDKFQRAFQDLVRSMDRTEQAEEKLKKKTKDLNRETDDFLQTIGQVGILYAFQRGLQSVVAAGSQYELRIKSVQVVTNDFSDALHQLAMTSEESIHGPRRMAEAFENLGQAGIATKEIIQSTDEVLDFATAAQLQMAQSAEAVISTAKSFQIEMGRSGEITDAFTVAMNAGSLAGQDFAWVMGSAGAVAKLANQDFREILAAASGMRDAGIQAQDAGTSIKSALLQLVNPTDEARKLMERLGISIYDASGQMRQWHEVVAEFERALAPYNEQARNMALATVFGSDGIRAMATSMNLGSDQLAALVHEMENAEGATKQVADVMANTMDGAMKRVNANFERMQILLFQDLEPGMLAFTDMLNGLIVGFNHLDQDTRQFIVTLTGSAGLIVALTVLVSLIRRAAMEMKLLSAAAWTNPWTASAAAIGLVISAIGSLVMASERARIETEKMIEKQKELNRVLQESNLTRSSDELQKLQELSSREEELNALYEERIQILQRIEELNAKMRDFSSEGLKEKIQDAALSFLPADLAKMFGMESPSRELIQLKGRLNEIDQAFADASLSADDYQQQMEEIKSDIDRSVTAHLSLKKAELDEIKVKVQQIETLKQLKAEYELLSGSQNLSEAGQQRLNQVIQELDREIPALTVVIDEQGRAHLRNAEIIGDRIRVEEQLLSAKKTSAIEFLKIQRTTAQAEADILRTRIENASKMAKTMAEIPLFAKIQQFNAATLGEEYTGAQEQAEDDLAHWQRVVQQIDDLIADIQNPTPITGGKGIDSLGLGKEGESKPKPPPWIEGFRVGLEQLTSTIDPVVARTAAMSDAVSFLATKERALVGVWESGAGTLRDLNALEKVRNEQIQALKDHQAQLHNENVRSEELHGRLSARLTELHELHQSGKITKEDYREATKSVNAELIELERSIRRNSQAWWEDQNAILSVQQAQAELHRRMKEERNQRRNDAFQSAMDLMRHEVAMARMSTDQQIRYLELLKDSHSWTKSQMWSIEEDLFSLRQQRTREMMLLQQREHEAAIKAIREEFDERRRQIESRYEQQRRKIDDQEHLREKQALLDEIAKYEQGTSERAREYTEELREKLREMEVEEKKRSLEDQKDAELKALEEERKRFEDNLAKLRNAYEEHSMDIAGIEAIAQDARVLAWQEGNDRIRELLLDLAQDYEQIASNMELPASPSPIFPVPQDNPHKSTLEAILRQKERYDTATGDAERRQANATAENLRNSLPSGLADLTRQMTADQLRQYVASLNTGGKTTDEGLAYLHPDEVVVRAPVVRRIEAMADMSLVLNSGFQMLAAEMRQLQMQVNIEKIIEVNDPRFEDDIDLRSLGTEAGSTAASIIRRTYAGGV